MFLRNRGNHGVRVPDVNESQRRLPRNDEHAACYTHENSTAANLVIVFRSTMLGPVCLSNVPLCWSWICHRAFELVVKLTTYFVQPLVVVLVRPVWSSRVVCEFRLWSMTLTIAMTRMASTMIIERRHDGPGVDHWSDGDAKTNTMIRRVIWTLEESERVGAVAPPWRTRRVV